MERRSPRPRRARAAHAGRRRLPDEFLAQNGAQLHQNTKITVTGCPKAKKKHKARRHRRASRRKRR